MTEERHVGPFRWRGEWNWKDITERAMGGLLGGTAAGATAGAVIWSLGRLFGE